MDKRFLMLIALVCISSLVLAAGPNEEAGGEMTDTGPPAETGTAEPGPAENAQAGEQPQVVAVQTANQGEEQKIMVQQREQVRAQSPEELGQMIQARQQEMSQEMSGKSEKEQKVLQNQNQVRLAVHALLAMEDLAGGIGPQVSEIARNFDNSVQATIRAEEKIQAKSGFARFFTGGDEKAAAELEREVSQNQQRIQELKQLKDSCDCGEEVKSMMQEQIQNMEQEQNRLQELSQKEQKSKGLFGWIWK
ncbi:hypothetical protein JXB28_06405 [Candidatus Woesearchaeota archaeon]|nr:hypothetical protein [Candidatus Woesearchaeota archaeon]